MSLFIEASQINAYRQAILSLSKMKTENLRAAMQTITEIAAHTLKVERVGIWFFDEGQKELQCKDLYRLSENSHEEGFILQAHHYPRYFQALRESRTLAAADALNDPRTSEFAETYLNPLNIKSMLDVSVRLEGNVVGVVCHEHIGAYRTWTPEEIDFAASLADMTALAVASWQRQKSEAALRAGEERYRTVLEGIEEGYYEVDLAGNLTFFNDTLCKMLGYSREELLGMNYRIYTPPEDRERLYRAFHEVFLTGVSLKDFEWKVISKDGTRGYGEASVVLMRDEKGSPIGFRGLVRDTTERRKVQETLARSEERYRNLVENSFDGIFIQRGTKIIFANRRLYEMLGYRPPELEGRDHWLVYHPDYQELTRQRVQARLRGENPPANYEVKLLRKDGSSFDGEINAKVIQYLGEPGIQVWIRDISEQKEAQQIIARREAILRALSFAAETFLKSDDWEKNIHEVLALLGKASEASRVYIFENHLSPEGTILCSQRHEWVAPGIIPFIDDPDLQNFALRSRGFDRWEQLLSRGETVRGRVIDFPLSEKKYLSRQQIKSILVVPIFVEKNWWGFIGFDQCVKETDWPEAEVDVLKIAAETFGAAIKHRLAQAAILEERERFRALAENLPLGLLMIAKDGTYEYLNHKFKELFGYDLAELPHGKAWFRKAFPDPDYRREVIAAWVNDFIKAGPGEKRPRTFAVRSKEGTEKIIQFVPVELKSGQHLMTCEDVTEKVKAEEDLKRLSQENYIMAEIGRIISSSLNIEEVYPRFAEEVKKLIPFDRLTINVTNFKENKVICTYVHGLEVAGRQPGDSFPLPGSMNEYLMKEKRGLFFGVKDENDFTKIKSIFPNLLPDYQSNIRSFLAVPLMAKDEVIASLHFRAQKENVYAESHLRLAERVGKEIAGAIANAHLFKELRQAQEEKMTVSEQLRQAQKMEAIGRLAGGIAHDFNNLLTVIKGYAELSSMRLEPGHPVTKNIGEIQKAATRAANLTQQLLAFSRRQILEFKVLNLNAVVNDLNKMLPRILGEDIELSYHLCPQLGMVKTDQNQIGQAILNLVVNARDAMPEGGKLIIETANVELSEEYARTHADVNPGRYVLLAVSDTGCGMTQEIRDRLFEPFFTTKEKGKGTGLGLSMVYGMVKQSGGHINVYTEVGVGTTFKIYLPRVEAQEEKDQGDNLNNRILTGKEKILFVEDDPAVRELTVSILDHLGYEVWQAASGQEALALVQRERGQKFDLLLTDVIMPGMSGKVLSDHMQILQPGIKVLFVSGYTDNAIVHHGVLDEGVNFIHKPFNPEALAKKIREVLEGGK